MRTWSRRRRVITLAAAVVAAWTVLLTIQLVSASFAVARGSDDLASVRSEATVADLTSPITMQELQRSHDGFADAEAKLANPIVAPARLVPILGRQVRALDRLASSGSKGTAAALEALADVQELSEQPRAGGPERIAMLRDLETTAGRLHRRISALSTGEATGLIGPLADAVTEAAEGQRQAARSTGQLEDASAGLADLFEGPSSYLLIGANNAEMRAGSGMFLTATELHFEDGRASLGEVRPTADLVLPAGKVTATGDLQANWGWLDPGRDLRQLGVSADFPQSAATAVTNWEAIEGNGPVDGVIVIDVDGIRSLLRAVGPVEVDGVTYTPDNVRGELLRAQYQRYEGDRPGRRDQLGEVARAIFERIESGDWELGELATHLTEASASRHLLVWSAADPLQTTWAELNADGHLREDSLAVNLLNRSANKLDSWIDTAAEVEMVPHANGTTALRLTYRITNRSTGEGPRYLVGPGIEGLEAGDYRGLAVVNLPAGTTNPKLDGARLFLEGGDGPTVVVAGEVTVRAGETATVVVTADLPEGLDQVTLEPAARIPRTTWTVDGREAERGHRQAAPVPER